MRQVRQTDRQYDSTDNPVELKYAMASSSTYMFLTILQCSHDTFEHQEHVYGSIGKEHVKANKFVEISIFFGAVFMLLIYIHDTILGP